MAKELKRRALKPVNGWATPTHLTKKIRELLLKAFERKGLHTLIDTYKKNHTNNFNKMDCYDYSIWHLTIGTDGRAAMTLDSDEKEAMEELTGKLKEKLRKFKR